MTFKPWNPSAHPETDVPSASGINFGFQSAAALAIARSRGVPDVALYADAERSVFGLTVLASSPYHKLRDLKNKTIGYQADELYVPETMMANVGLANQWKPREVGFDTSALTSGSVDAYLSFITNEPIALKLQGVKTRVFPAANYGFHFYDDVLFTTNGLIRSNPKLVRTVVTLIARGFTYTHKYPVKAAKLVVKHYFHAGGAQNLKQQILESKAFVYYSKDVEGRFSGLMTPVYWSDSVKTLFRYHIINNKPPVGSLFTNRFNPN